MDLQAYFDSMMVQHRAESGVYSIAMLLKLMTEYGLECKVRCFDEEGNEFYLRKDWGSDRGDYHNLAIRLANVENILSSEEVISILENALSTGIMTGYKGGEFPIKNSTLVYIGEYGKVGYGIVDVNKIKDEIIF